jgi:filamentous hemagglutinin family protein
VTAIAIGQVIRHTIYVNIRKKSVFVPLSNHAIAMFITQKTAKIFLLTFLLCLLPLPSKAQEITPDGTTATEVNSADGSNFDIGGGDKAGGNLFHSFGKFGVPTGGSANFLNSPDVENIINRVTGGNVSNIDGLLKANGGANLFLINPAGIIFGQNARLDIGGSFLGSTADSLLFNDGTEFSAVNATGKPLLTINAPIGLNFRDTPADIQVQGNGQGTRTTTDLIDTPDALRVNSDKTFALVGGNLNFDGATIKTAGGRIELGSVGSVASGKVSLTPVDKGWSLGYEGIQNFGDIGLSNQATVDASGLGGGDIQVQGKNIFLRDGSQIEASTIGDIGQQGGTLKVNALDSIELDGVTKQKFDSGFVSQVYKGAIGNAGNLNIETGNLTVSNGAQINATAFGQGNAGNLNIETGNLTVSNGAQISTNTRGQGNAGNVTINAGDTVSFDGTTPQEIPSAVFTTVEAGAKGKGGDINITAKNLSLTNGGNLNAFVRSASKDIPGGQGDAGKVNLNIGNNLSIAGISESGTRSGIFSLVGRDAIGRGGDINIAARNFSIADGARLVSSTDGEGDAGNITINAANSVSLNNSDLFTSVLFSGIGNAGRIDITTPNISVTNGSKLASSTNGEGNAGKIAINAANSVLLDNSNLSTEVDFSGIGKGGDINITTNNLSLDNSAKLSSETSGEGEGGNINLQVGSLSMNNNARLEAATIGKSNAGNITINATDNVSLNNSEISNDTIVGQGNAGNININTKNLSLTNDSIFFNFVGLSTGAAGKIQINASDTISLDNSRFISGSLFGKGSGSAGEIIISTKNLFLTNKSSLSGSSFFSKKNAGDIVINATDAVSLNNSTLSSAVFLGEGKGGSIDINTKKLSLTNDSSVDSSYTKGTKSSSQLGSAGNINLNTDSLTLKNSSISANTTSGKGGNINLNVGNTLQMRDKSKISAEASGIGDGGNIKIDADTIVAFPNQNNDIIASAETGDGGNINITTQGIFGLKKNQSNPPNQSNDIDASSKFGSSGNVFINNIDVDPTQGIEQSPQNVVEPDETVSEACSGSADIAKENSFTIVGRGGFPSDPTKPLNSSILAGVSGSRQESGGAEGLRSRGAEEKKTLSSDEIVPARGMTINEKGQVVLTAYPTPNASDRPVSQSNYCSDRQAKTNTGYIFSDRFFMGGN